ncbi:Hypothetical_protein [Hexamita inflata]|uniref:Hypothetical_protein n=1 Tax=Hexamita inflata TaxID=28002 RepID=A0AA86RDW7_9EUKA|nr:Hypothetical protein HINF_LOCUS60523 [Hexamita inflata]
MFNKNQTGYSVLFPSAFIVQFTTCLNTCNSIQFKYDNLEFGIISQCGDIFVKRRNVDSRANLVLPRTQYTIEPRSERSVCMTALLSYQHQFVRVVPKIHAQSKLITRE